MLYTLEGSGERDGGFLIDLETNREQLALDGHQNSVLDGALAADGQLVATADADAEIRVWKRDSGRLPRRSASRAARPWSAGWDSRSRAVAWGTSSDYQSSNDRGPLQWAFQLEQFDFVPLPAECQRAVTRFGSASLELVDTTTLLVKREGGHVTRLAPLAPLDQIRCYSFLDQQTVALGSDLALVLLDAMSGFGWPGSRRGPRGSNPRWIRVVRRR